MPQLGLKQQCLRNEDTVSKLGGLSIVAGDLTAMVITAGFTERRVFHQQSGCSKPDTSSVWNADPSLGKDEQIESSAKVSMVLSKIW